MKLSKPQIIQQHSSRIYFTRSGVVLYPRPQFIVSDNVNVEFKRETKQIFIQDNYGIILSNQLQLQLADHKKMQSLSEYTNKVVFQ
jgi:hypothetical protein